MTEKQYNEATIELNKIEKRQKVLAKKILDYENECLRPEFTVLSEVVNFVRCYEEGAMFDYQGVTYVLGSYQDIIEEYGSEGVVDAMSDAAKSNMSIEDFENNFGIIQIVKTNTK